MTATLNCIVIQPAVAEIGEDIPTNGLACTFMCLPLTHPIRTETERFQEAHRIDDFENSVFYNGDKGRKPTTKHPGIWRRVRPAR